MKRATWMLAAVALLFGGVSQTKADMIYDTASSWDGSSSISAWGSVLSGATATYGQTFIAPTNDSVLQNFTFYINGGGGQGTVTYQADVYAWSGSLVAGNSPQGSTGSPLFSLSNLTFTDNGSFQAVTINTGGLALTPGNAYVALFTTSDPTSITANSGSTGNFAFGANLFAHGSNNGGGGFNYYDNTSSSQLSTPPWDDSSDYGDLAWTAHFVSPVPEPSGFALLAMGAVCLAIGCALWASRRKLIHDPSFSQ